MRDFDLEAAKRGEPIRTRDGSPARLIAHVPEAKERMRLVVLVDSCIYSLGEDGRCDRGACESGVDLFMDTKKRTVWVNLYSYPTRWGNDAKFFDTEDDASEEAQERLIKRIGNRAWPLEIEE